VFGLTLGLEVLVAASDDAEKARVLGARSKRASAAFIVFIVSGEWGADRRLEERDESDQKCCCLLLCLQMKIKRVVSKRIL
jgi:hypothetical protein